MPDCEAPSFKMKLYGERPPFATTNKDPLFNPQSVLTTSTNDIVKSDIEQSTCSFSSKEL
jgi:hypothetical protein